MTNVATAQINNCAAIGGRIVSHLTQPLLREFVLHDGLWLVDHCYWLISPSPLPHTCVIARMLGALLQLACVIIIKCLPIRVCVYASMVTKQLHNVKYEGCWHMHYVAVLVYVIHLSPKFVSLCDKFYLCSAENRNSGTCRTAYQILMIRIWKARSFNNWLNSPHQMIWVQSITGLTRRSIEMLPLTQFRRSIDSIERVMDMIFMQQHHQRWQNVGLYAILFVHIWTMIGSAYTMVAYEWQQKFIASIMFIAYIMVCAISLNFLRRHLWLWFSARREIFRSP